MKSLRLELVLRTVHLIRQDSSARFIGLERYYTCVCSVNERILRDKRPNGGRKILVIREHLPAAGTAGKIPALAPSTTR